MKPIPIPGFAEPVSSWTHLLSAAAVLVGVFFLLRRGKGNASRVTALSVYSVCLVFLFSMSGVFHLLPEGAAKPVLQRLDHAGIWVTIAGTFTPIHTILFRGLWRWLPLLLIWAVAITGLVLQVIFFDSIPEWLVVTLFLSLGWFGFFSMLQFRKIFDDTSIRLLLIGGLFYSVGAICEFLRWPNLISGVIGPHEVFHFFVILGALTHWRFVYHWAGHPVADIMRVDVRVFPNQVYEAKVLGESIEVKASSREELKDKVSREIAQRFHKSITPMIKLRFYDEEHL